MMYKQAGLKHNVDELLVGVLKQILLRQVFFILLRSLPGTYHSHLRSFSPEIILT